MLLASMAKPDAVDDEGYTPLLLAVANGNIPVVKRLLAAGADVNLASKIGESPLSRAVASQNQAIAGVLLGAKADPNVMMADPNVIMPGREGMSAFGAIFTLENEEEREKCVELFLEHGADPFLEAAPAVRHAPPEWRIKLLRSLRYPVLAGKAEVSLVYGNEAVERTLEVRKEETAAPGSLPELMMAWSLRASSGLGTAEGAIDWTTLRLWRKGADGKMEETVIAVKDGIEWPVLQWGDVVEVLSPIAAAESLKPAGGPIGPGGRRRVVLPPSPPGGPPIPAETMELLKRAK
jgi:hypothetical protein